MLAVLLQQLEIIRFRFEGKYSALATDTGSGYGESNDHLFSGLETVKSDFGEKITLGSQAGTEVYNWQDVESVMYQGGTLDEEIVTIKIKQWIAFGKLKTLYED